METTGRRPPAATRTRPSSSQQVPPRCAQAGVRESAPSGAGTRQPFLSQHPRGVQSFNNDVAVGFSQPCRQDVQAMSADIVDPAMQPGNFYGALAILSRPFHTARAGTADVPQLFERSLQRPWVGDPFKDLAALVSDGRQPTNPDVDPDPRVRQRHLRLDRSLHQYPNTRVDPGSVATHRNREHPRPAATNQPFDPAHVLMGTDGADHRQCQMSAVRFYAHRAGGETHPIAVAALLLEPRESDSFPGAIARARVCHFQYASTAPLMPSA